MDKRKEFVLKALSRTASITELCGEFGISRKTGYNDALGRLTNAVRRDGMQATYSYDLVGNRIRSTRTLGSVALETEYLVNNLNQTISTARSDGVLVLPLEVRRRSSPCSYHEFSTDIRSSTLPSVA